MIKQPPFLQKGDTIGITCPAGYMAKEKAQTCIETLQKWGFKVVVGNTVGSHSTNYFAGTDEVRLQELQSMLNDKNIHAILCGRGGYGTGSIIDTIDFSQFKKNPKWVIGYSDITILHTHIHTNLKIASLHSPMASAFNDGGANDTYLQSLKKVLLGKKLRYKCAPHSYNHIGEATGELVGGNLSILAHIIGTKSDLKTNNKILFIEDIGEYIYSIDRMMQQLKRSGKLAGLKGLIIGGFTDIKDTERPFGKTVYEAINDLVKEYAYPICFEFPVSHSNKNYPLKVGVIHQLIVEKRSVQLLEL